MTQKNEVYTTGKEKRFCFDLKNKLICRFGRDENLLASDSQTVSLESLDPNELFRYLFGGEEFQSIVGEFELAKTFKSAFVDMVNESDGNERTMSDAERVARRQTESEEKRRAHEQRVNELSKNLIQKLNLFTEACNGTKHDPSFSRAEVQFIQTIQTEMEQLIQAPYGENLLHSIGYIYSLKARFWSTKFDTEESSFFTRVSGRTRHFHSACQEKAHVVRETFRTLKSAVKWGQSVSRLAQATEGDTDEESLEINRNAARLEYSGSESQEKSKTVKTRRKSSSKAHLPLTVEQKQELEADMVTKSMQALWQAVKLEVESVEREVCDKVLNDSSCDRDILRRRCFALSKIGHLWQNVESAKNSNQ